MNEKYNAQYEKQIVLMAENKVRAGKIEVFDYLARIIKSEKFPQLVRQGTTDNENCLVIANRDGETIVLTEEFQITLYNALKGRFG